MSTERSIKSAYSISREAQAFSHTTIVDSGVCTDGVLLYLVEGRSNKPQHTQEMRDDVNEANCPYCSESLKTAAIQPFLDWTVIANRYPGTDREALAVSNEHSPFLYPADVRTWMHLAKETGGTVIYSPAKKSIPFHKHAPLFWFPESPLLQAQRDRVTDSADITHKYQHNALYLHGEFDERYEETINLMKKLYSRGQMFDIAINPESTFLLPSKRPRRIVGNRVFIGIASTESKPLFSSLTSPKPGEQPQPVPDYSDCNYAEEELRDLLKGSPSVSLPDVNVLQSIISKLGITPKDVLSINEESAIAGYALSAQIGIDFSATDVIYATDKKNNLIAEHNFSREVDREEGTTIALGSQTSEGIGELIRTVVVKGKDLLFLQPSDEDTFTVSYFQENKEVQTFTTPSISIEVSGKDSSLDESIDNIKQIVKADNTFIELVIAVEPRDIHDLSQVFSSFKGANKRIIRIPTSNVRDALRPWNETTGRVLDLHSDSIPKDYRLSYSIEEGAVVCYIGDQSMNPESIEEIVETLEKSIGRKIYVLEKPRNEEDSDLLLKPGADVKITPEIVMKKMNSDEQKAYMLLHPYREALRQGSVSIVIPELLGQDPESGYMLIQKLDGFQTFTPKEYFGEADIYTEEYFKQMVQIWKKIRDTVELSSPIIDYDTPVNGIVPTALYLTQIRDINGDIYMNEQFDQVMDIVQKTQPSIIDMPQYASHRDPNPGNYSVDAQDETISAKIIDWETFDLSRKGYDEGRFFTYLSLSSEKQAQYLKIVLPTLTENEQTYFWRTVATRAYREISLFLSGHYDKRLDQSSTDKSSLDIKDEIVAGLSEQIQLACEESRKLL